MPWKTQLLTVVAFLRCGCCVRPGSFRVKTRIRSNHVSVAKVTRLLCFATCWGPALWSLSLVVSSCSSKNLGLILLILRLLKEFAGAYLWEFAKQDVSSILHGGISVRSNISCSIWIPSFMDNRTIR
ncbi:uncharacterized protein A4U43_C02F21810 [Asparagus officinalis]|uniref:Secreted protein n=1 Tax=Asparagus officinalis TaxID=4686 RepID=A0A5P1FKD3_ASPOF|nr:uncharacterized protein A4U43_C02F21810 [Asparagus officinalis]